METETCQLKEERELERVYPQNPEQLLFIMTLNDCF